MSEDFIIDEEGSEDGTTNRRPFLIAVGVLSVLLIISAVCAGVSLLSGNGNGTEVAQATINARETENAIIAVTNTAVAVTIESMTVQAMTAAAVSPTPSPTNTPTPAPTDTPTPTDTPVVVDVEETETPEVIGTTEFDTGGDSTPTPIAIVGGDTGGNGSTGGSTGGGGSDTLPDTGFETWGVLLAGFALVVILVAARRLRSG